MGIAGVVAVALCTFFLGGLHSAVAEAALDFCVGDFEAPSLPTGYACKKRDLLTAHDFAYNGLRNPGKADSLTKTAVAPAFAREFPALTGLGLSAARVDIQPGGVVVTQGRPISSELVLIVEGRVLVGFVSPDNVRYNNTLEKGDIMAIPRGVLHYLINAGKTAATAYATFSSPTPGLQWTSHTFLGNHLSNSASISDSEIERLKDLLANDSRNMRLSHETDQIDNERCFFICR